MSWDSCGDGLRWRVSFDGCSLWITDDNVGRVYEYALDDPFWPPSARHVGTGEIADLRDANLI